MPCPHGPPDRTRLLRRGVARLRALARAGLAFLLAPLAAAGAEPLRAGDVIEGAFQAPGERVFESVLEAGQLAQVEVGQIGLDVALEVIAPDGTVLAKLDQARVRESMERLTWIVTASGSHRIVLRTGRTYPDGRYRLRLAPTRIPGPADLSSIEAERAFVAGVRARDESDADSRRRAVAAFESAGDLWRRAGDRRAQSRALVAAGILQWVVDPEAALENCTMALGLVQDQDDFALEADALSCLAESHYAAGQYDEAIESQENARAAAVAGGNRFRECEALQNLGVFHAGRRESDRARTLYEESIVLAREIGDEEVLGVGLSSLSAVLYEAGENQRSHDLAREGLEVHRASGNLAQQVQSFMGLAASLAALGDYDAALNAASEVVRIARATGQRANEAYGLFWMSWVESDRGDWNAALELALQALELAQHANTPREERIALEGVALAHFKAGAYPEALEAIAAGAEVSRRMGIAPTAFSLFNLCRVREAMGDADGALEACTVAQQAIRSGGPQRYEPLLSYLFARLERHKGRLDEAQLRSEESLAQLEKWRGQLRRRDWRQSFIESHREIEDFHVDLMVEAAARDGGQARAAEAFDAAERARTRALRDALTESRQPGRDGVDERLVARERLLAHQVAREVEGQLRRASGPASPEPAADARLVQLEKELKEVENEIGRLRPRYASLNESAPIGVARFQQGVLDDETTLLAFATGESRGALWVVTREQLRMHVLPGRAVLVELVQSANKSFSTPRQPAAAAARELGRLLLGPALPLLRTRVVVVADGTLHYLPFGALPDPRGGTLLDRHEVVALPSVSTVGLLRARAATDAPRRTVAVLADPVFRGDDARIPAPLRQAGPRPLPPTRELSRAAQSFGGLEELSRLVLTRREARAIAGLAGAPLETKLALDFEANLQTAREGRLGDYRFVHFATHGFLNPRRPELSGLVLSLFDAKGRPQDGFLSALDAFNLDLNADVVVLSGCRTALGKEVRGEGLVGLPQAFMYAGARRVVSSLWAVDDAATAALMERFYQGLLAREPLRPAAALRAAQSYVRSRPQWRHPYYWAAFQLQGDWN